jgi:hypothetical protein
MKYDEDKVDEVTMALMYLAIRQSHEGVEPRADSFERLRSRGFVCEAKGKAEPVSLTEKGVMRAEQLFFKHFGKGAEEFLFQGFWREPPKEL